MSDFKATVGPHPFEVRPWRFDRWKPVRYALSVVLPGWLGGRICHHCFAPKRLHPRTGWVRARPLGENYYIGTTAPHFNEGW